MTKAEFIITGCGNAAGTPTLTNYWGKCDPQEPKNKRLRPAALIRTKETTLAIDTGPDFREQALRHGISDLDAVFYTHEHGDHVHGVDELRTLHRLNNEKVFPIYSNAQTLKTLQQRFDYMFEETGKGFYKAVLLPKTLSRSQAFEIGDIPVQSYEQDHGTCVSLGFRFGEIAYSTDMVGLDDEAIKIIQGVKIWIADAAAYHSDTNPVHAGLNKVYALNEKIGAEKVYLTHLPPTMDYQTLLKELPEGFLPAYDGLGFEIAL